MLNTDAIRMQTVGFPANAHTMTSRLLDYIDKVHKVLDGVTADVSKEEMVKILRGIVDHPPIFREDVETIVVGHSWSELGIKDPGTDKERRRIIYEQIQHWYKTSELFPLWKLEAKHKVARTILMALNMPELQFSVTHNEHGFAIRVPNVCFVQSDRITIQQFQE